MTVNDLSDYLIENFHKMVDIPTDDENACWTFKNCKDKYGRGMVRNGKKRIRAPRVAYILAKGELPDDMYACHECDNPSCVRPSHLWAGTPLDNLMDAISKGRHKGIEYVKRAAIAKAHISEEKYDALLASMQSFYTETATYKVAGRN